MAGPFAVKPEALAPGHILYRSGHLSLWLDLVRSGGNHLLYDAGRPAMNETLTPEPTERHKTLIVVLTLITTIISAIVAGLQADANIRANNANRDSQYYAVLISGELRRSGLQSSYDMSTFAGVMRESQTALIMGLTALESEQASDELGAAINNQEALAAQARADQFKRFSIFFTDPRYAPKNADELPDSDAYLVDSTAKANELLQKQNAAADEYHQWNNKADAYVGVLTVMAVAFFLLGLAQALTGRMRLVFAIFGGVILVSASAWAMLILAA
ncbi:MAG TPA: hypothetical protein VFI68_15720 [Anaerolineales bacterium]|nr:hypothetical protein [Anaerolineales bacterium]